MPRGRKPTPDRIKALNGNPGKRPPNDSPPAFAAGAKCPAWLDAYAREEWELVAGELGRLGMLHGVDTATVASYCEACSLLRHANDEIAANGGLTTIDCGKSGLRRHPAVGTALDAIRTIKSFAAEFGFTPSSRARVKAPGGPADPFEELMREVRDN